MASKLENLSKCITAIDAKIAKLNHRKAEIQARITKLRATASEAKPSATSTVEAKPTVSVTENVSTVNSTEAKPATSGVETSGISFNEVHPDLVKLMMMEGCPKEWDAFLECMPVYMRQRFSEAELEAARRQFRLRQM